MALLVWAALRTTILQWGEGVVEHKVHLIGNIDVHMVLLTNYVRILNHQRLSDRSACIP